jgi:acyl-coenzyme A synthetase/AMP-(fatty) acid ligase
VSPRSVEHAGEPAAAEAAAVGASDATTGLAIVAFITVKGDGVDGRLPPSIPSA